MNAIYLGAARQHKKPHAAAQHRTPQETRRSGTSTSPKYVWEHVDKERPGGEGKKLLTVHVYKGQHEAGLPKDIQVKDRIVDLKTDCAARQKCLEEL